jgi:Flp pilus assembly protein protease CpaA
VTWDARDAVMALLLGVACFTDITTGKIRNWLTFPTMAGGVLLSAWLAPHPWDGALGLLLAFGCGVVLWKFGGAYRPGDVKLVMAAGAVGGPEWVLRGILIGLLLNFPFALVVLLLRGRLAHFGRFVVALGKALIYRRPMKHFMAEWESKTTVIAFGPVIAAGIVVARLQPWPDLW